MLAAAAAAAASRGAILHHAWVACGQRNTYGVCARRLTSTALRPCATLHYCALSFTACSLSCATLTMQMHASRCVYVGSERDTVLAAREQDVE